MLPYVLTKEYCRVKTIHYYSELKNYYTITKISRANKPLKKTNEKIVFQDLYRGHLFYRRPTLLQGYNSFTFARTTTDFFCISFLPKWVFCETNFADDGSTQTIDDSRDYLYDDCSHGLKKKEKKYTQVPRGAHCS